MYSSQQSILVRKYLAEILESDGFSQAPQLCNFLTYVVDKTLLNKTDEIKGYSIGIDALGRNSDFDPQSDSTVRVMAGRLRRALKTFNEQNADRLNVSISIPVGSYVPEFEFTNKPQPVDARPASKAKTISPNNAYFLGGLISLLILIISWVIWTYITPFADQTTKSRQTYIQPDVAIARISVSLLVNKDPMPEWFSKEEASEGLLTAFSKFNEFEIVRSSGSKSIVSDTAANRVEVSDYHFSALLGRAGTSSAIRAFLSLTRQSNGAIIWSDTVTVPKFGNPNGTDSSIIAGKLISPLVSPYGIIYGDLSGQYSSPKSSNCILLAYNYFATEKMATYASARKCIDESIKLNRVSSSLHAILAFLNVENYRKNLSGFEKDPLASAKENARIAIQLDPQNARAHQAVFAIQKVSNHPIQASIAAEKGIKLNPFDSDIIGDYAAYLISLGKFSKADPFLKQALQLNPSTPVWLQFFTFLQADMTGNHKQADIIAANIDPDQSPLAALAVALSAARMDDIERARYACSSIARQEPEFVKDPDTALKRRGFDKAIITHITSILDCKN